MAEGLIGTAGVLIRPDTHGFEESARVGVLGSLKRVALAAGGIFAGIEVGHFLKDATTDAAHLDQQLIRSHAIFKDAADAVDSFASNAAQSLGLSEAAALTATTTFGQLFVQMGEGPKPAEAMSERLVTLARDLSTFNDVPIDRVFKALRGGLAGQTRGLKSLGIVLSDQQLRQEAVTLGLVKNVKIGLDPQQKALAVYQLLLKDTGAAQGAFGREGDKLQVIQAKLSAEWQNAQETIGKELLPVVISMLQVFARNAPAAIHVFVGAVRGVITAVGDIADSVKVAAAPFAPFFAAAEYGFGKNGIGGAINAMLGQLTKVVPAFEPIRKAVGSVISEIKISARGVDEFFARFEHAHTVGEKINVTVSGLEAAARQVEHFLFGVDKKVRDHSKLGLFETVHVDGLVDGIEKSLSQVDWSGLAKGAAAALATGVKTGAAALQVAVQVTQDSLDKILGDITAWVNANSGKLGAIGAGIAADMLAALLDPSFWAHHWDLALSVALLLLPEGMLGKIGIRIGSLLLKPLELLGRPIAEVLGRAISDAAVGIAASAERLGGAIGAALGRALSSLGRIGSIGDVIGQALGAARGAVGDLISRAFTGAGTIISRAVQRLGTSIGGGIIDAVTGAEVSVQGASTRLAEGIVKAISRTLNKLPGLIRPLIKLALLDQVIQFGAQALGAAASAGAGIASGVIAGVKALPGELGHQLAVSLADLVHLGTQSGAQAEKIGTEIARGIKTAPGKLAGLAGDLSGRLIGALVSAARDAVSEAESIGLSIAEGIASGIVNGIPAIASAIGRAAGAIPGKFKSLLGMHSPSRVMAEQVGRPIAQGIALGMEQESQNVADRASRSLALATQAAGKGAAAAGRAAGKTTADEILLGFLAGTEQLPAKWSQKLTNVIQAVATRVQGQQQKLADAFTQASDKAFQAFDASTQAGLDRIAKRFAGYTGIADSIGKVFGGSKSSGSAVTGFGATIAQQLDVQGLGAALAKKLGVAATTAWAALDPTQQAKAIKIKTEQFESDLGDVWKRLPKDMQAALADGGAAMTAQFQKDEKTIDDTLASTNRAIDAQLAQATARFDLWQQQSDATTAAWAKGQSDAVNAALAATLASIDAWDKQLTPTEQLIHDQQAAHDAAQAQQQLADAQQAVADAQKELSDAQAAADPDAILKAQKDLADAQRAQSDVLFQQQLAQEQTQADAERAQRDQQAEDERKAAQDDADAKLAQIQAEADAETAAHAAAADAQRAQAQADADAARAQAQTQHDTDAAARQAAYDADQAALQDAHDRVVNELTRQQNREAVEYQASRNLLREHLAKRLAIIENSIETEKDGWKRHHAAIMQLFHDITGDYQTAGTNLGQAFIQGLRESEHGVEGMAETLARAIAKYLQLHSPAEKGPLSSLASWWKPLVPTLARGVDTAGIDHLLDGVSPRGMAASGVYGAAGDPQVLRKLDELIGAVKEHRDGDLTLVAAQNAGPLLDRMTSRVGG